MKILHAIESHKKLNIRKLQDSIIPNTFALEVSNIIQR